MSNTGQPSKTPISTAYIALGSNLGDRAGHLRSAVAALRGLGCVETVSSVYETEPVGTIAQPEFLNAVIELRTEMQPEELLRALLKIEHEHGRDRDASLPKGPRTLDLDLLAYDAQILETPGLTLPHPALQERLFVLIPLTEIAPDWVHPVSGRNAAELLAELSATLKATKGHTEGNAVRQLPMKKLNAD